MSAPAMTGIAIFLIDDLHFGLARFQHGDTAEALTSRAHEALYAAKDAGRIRVWSSGTEQTPEHCR